jgi:hypothetical protein
MSRFQLLDFITGYAEPLRETLTQVVGQKLCSKMESLVQAFLKSL